MTRYTTLEQHLSKLSEERRKSIEDKVALLILDIKNKSLEASRTKS